MMVERTEKLMRLTEKGEKVEVFFIWNDDELVEIKRTTWLNISTEPVKHKECHYKMDNPENFREIMEKELEYLKKMRRLQEKLERDLKRHYTV